MTTPTRKPTPEDLQRISAEIATHYDLAGIMIIARHFDGQQALGAAFRSQAAVFDDAGEAVKMLRAALETAPGVEVV